MFTMPEPGFEDFELGKGGVNRKARMHTKSQASQTFFRIKNTSVGGGHFRATTTTLGTRETKESEQSGFRKETIGNDDDYYYYCKW